MYINVLDTFAAGLLVLEGIICLVIRVSALIRGRIQDLWLGEGGGGGGGVSRRGVWGPLPSGSKAEPW